MASGGSDGLSDSSNEEQDFFASFTVEEISEMRQDCQRQREQGSLRDVDEEIVILIDQQPQDRVFTYYMACTVLHIESQLSPSFFYQFIEISQI